MDGDVRWQGLQLRAQAPAQICLGQPADGRGRGVLAAAGGAARQEPGLHPDPVRPHQGHRQATGAPDRPAVAVDRNRQGLCAELRAQLPVGQRGRGGRQAAADGQGKRRRHGPRLAAHRLRRFGRLEDPRMACQRTGHAGAQRPVPRHQARPGAGDLPAREGVGHPAPAAGKGRRRRGAQPQPARPRGPGQERGHQVHQRAQGHGLLHQPQPEEPAPGQTRGARGPEMAGRLRGHRQDADQEHRCGAPELPAQGPAGREQQQPLPARSGQGEGLAEQGRPG